MPDPEVGALPNIQTIDENSLPEDPLSLTARRANLIGALFVCVFLLVQLPFVYRAIGGNPSDDTRYTSAAYDLAFKGRLTTSVMGSDSFDLATMWQPPVYFLAQAAVFRVLGFSRLRARLVPLVSAASLILITGA